MRVLYFTAVPLVDESDGGRIHCRTLVKRLAEDANIELFAITAGKKEWREGTEAFFKALAVPHEFIELREGTFRPGKDTVGSIISFVVKAVFNFPWELQALNQEHVQAAVDWAVGAWKIDTLLLDYYLSALFVKLPRKDVRTAVTKLHREAEFYAGQIKRGQTVHGSLTAGISLWRMARFERHVDAAAGKVIAIAAMDLPPGRTRSKAVCITPYLDTKPEQWRFSDSKSAFFIGNINHYPNYLAVQWIATALAPALQTTRDDIKITIVGASRDQIPSSWLSPNVEFIGVADAATAVGLFRHADLMLAPIEHDAGVKFKAAEAVAYGTPMLASKQTLLGLPYLRDIPILPLESPQGAATLVARMIGSRSLLESLSKKQTDQRDTFIVLQKGIWFRTLSNIPLP